MRLKKTRNPVFLKSLILLFVLPVFSTVFLNSACHLKPKIESAAAAADTSVSDSSRITVLSQNTMLIPLDIVAPEYVKRTGLISEMLSKSEFDIVGLQEVFAGASQNSILQAWHLNAISDISGAGSVEGLWQPITGAKEVSELAESENRFGIKVLDAGPNNKPAKISFGPYYVLGPDAESSNIFKQDSGLLILSKFPIIAASAFSFSDAQGFDKLANKGVVYARIKIGPSDDDYIHFFNTHLQSHGYGETRFKNLSEFLEFVSNVIADDLAGSDDEASQNEKNANKDPESKSYKNDDNIAKDDPANPTDMTEALDSGSREGITVIQAGSIHPIIMVGDFNIKASRPAGWIEKANIISAPPGQIMPDDKDSSLNTSADYDEFVNYLKSFAGPLLCFEDLWKEFYVDDPGFTWIGKGWKTGAQNPYGIDGNPFATENGAPERIDYVVYYKGYNTLQLNPISVELYPSESTGIQVSDHLGLVSVFEFQN